MNPTVIKTIVAAQQRGEIACVMDARGDFNLDHARTAGVDMSRLLFSRPDHVEQANEIITSLVRSGAIDIIVTDGFIVEDDVTRRTAACNGTRLLGLPLTRPTFNLYSQAPGRNAALYVLAKNASAHNCVEWITAHARYGEGLRLFRAFQWSPSGERFVCAWIVEGGAGRVTTWLDVSIPREFA